MSMGGRYSGAPVSAPKWFRVAISEGLTRLIALSLPGAPSHETVALTKEAWIESLYHGRHWQAEDAQRIALGFRSLMRRIDRWPAPRVLLEHLPAKRELRKLPEPPMSQEAKARNRARVRKMIDTVLKK